MARPKNKTSPQSLGDLLVLARGNEILQREIRAAIPSQKSVKKSPRSTKKVIKPNKKKAAQEQLGNKNISNFELGSEIPSLKKLTDLVATIEKLRYQKDPKHRHRFFSDSEIVLFLSYWLNEQLKLIETKVARKPTTDKGQIVIADPLLEDYRRDFLKRSKGIVRKLMRLHTSGTFAAPSLLRPPTLEPAGLQTILTNCIIVVGASVHHPPDTVLDLFRQNGRLSDLMHLPLLNFGPNPLLLTDRMVISLSEEERYKLLGSRHLLVIGGSTVNVVTRFLTNCCVFRLCYAESKYRFDNIFNELQSEAVLEIPRAVEVFFELLKNTKAELYETLNKYNLGDHLKPEERQRLWDLTNSIRQKMGGGNVTYDEIMQVLSSTRTFFSPLGPTLIETDPEEGDASLSVVTLGANYWAKEDSTKVCLLVMGSNSFGTAGAVRALAQLDFTKRPLGALLRVKPSHAEEEYFRFIESVSEWVTDEYSVEDVVGKENLKKMMKRANKATSFAFHKGTQQLEEYKDFLQRFLPHPEVRKSK